jgi:signal transduction histidine kinase
MQEDIALQPDHQTSMRHWERTAPWYRKASMRIGLQRKLILCFMAVLVAAMSVTCWVFAREMHARLADVMGEQTRQMAVALSLASEDAIRHNDYAELNRRGEQLIKSRNIIFVAFLDANAHAKTLASRDLEFDMEDLRFVQTSLLQVRRRQSPTFGDYSEVVAPILSSPSSETEPQQHRTSPQLLGYVAVGISQMREETQLQSAQYLVIGIACVMMIIALPIASLLVHRIFFPIRKLVVVTKQISAGEFDAKTEIHRPDIIGDLARSFDEMVTQVKAHRQKLAAANEALAEANRDLEKKVEQRTAQLVTANSRLSDEIVEKESFLRAVSHDLNAPLRNIGGMASMLLMKHRDHLDDEMIHRLMRIKSNVDLEAGLIAELLELSRIKTRRQKMDRIDVGSMVTELRDLFESDLRGKSIELTIETPLPVLHGERTRIRQIFQNLIDNAIKYMGDSTTRKIRIGCEMRPTEVEFYVSDTGVGIDPADAEKIFFIFRRGKSSAASTVAGKGVGLTTVKSIVETYNGKIWVSGAPGEGSTFRFTINGKFLAQALSSRADAERAA